MRERPESLEQAISQLEQMARAFFPGGFENPSIRELAPASRVSKAERDRRVELRYRSLVERIPAVTFIASLDGDLNDLWVSPQIETLLGFSQDEWLSNPVLWFRQLHPDDRERCSEEFVRGCLTGGPFRGEFRALTRDGSTIWVRGEAVVVRDGAGRPAFLQGIAYDVTETKRAEEAVRRSLREKEILLKEVHHRVKNNLQMISSLLRLQASALKEPGALDALRVSQLRVQSMALVHEKLYRSDDLARIDFAGYVRSLASLLARSYGLEASRVRLAIDVDDVHLGIDVALPLGLILSELVSNAMKHGFPDSRDGEVRVVLRNDGVEGVTLTVRDDGVGLPRDASLEGGSSLGMHLVESLAKQIGATPELSSRPGETLFRLRIPVVEEVSTR